MPSIIKTAVIDAYLDLLHSYIIYDGINGDKNGTTILMLILLGRLPINKPIVTTTYDYGKDILVRTMYTDNLKIIETTVKYLVTNYNIINKKDKHRETALNYAIKNTRYHRSLVNLLLEYNIHINVRNIDGENVLQQLSSWCHVSYDLIQKLIDYGIDIDNRNRLGETALHTAVVKKDYELIELLIHNGINIHIKDNNGNNALHNLIQYGIDSNYIFDEVKKIIDILLEHKIDINEQNNSGKTVLDCETNSDLIKYLIDKGADINLRHTNPIFNVQDVDTIKYLLEKGLDINKPIHQGLTPLHNCRNQEKILFLLENGANVNVKDDLGRTPIMMYTKEDLIDIMIKHGADINVKDNDGDTLLHLLASNSKDIDLIKKLIRKGLKIDTQNKDGCIPLHYINSSKMVKILIPKNGINIRDYGGNTPLHLAMFRYNYGVVVKLIKHGADVNIESYDISLHNVLTPINVLIKKVTTCKINKNSVRTIMYLFQESGCTKPYDYYSGYIKQYGYKSGLIKRYNHVKTSMDDVLNRIKHYNKEFIKRGLGENIYVEKDLLDIRKKSLEKYNKELFNKKTLFVRCIVIINLNIHRFKRKDILGLNKDIRKYFRSYLNNNHRIYYIDHHSEPIVEKKYKVKSYDIYSETDTEYLSILDVQYELNSDEYNYQIDEESDEEFDRYTEQYYEEYQRYNEQYDEEYDEIGYAS